MESLLVLCVRLVHRSHILETHTQPHTGTQTPRQRHCEKHTCESEKYIQMIRKMMMMMGADGENEYRPNCNYKINTKRTSPRSNSIKNTPFLPQVTSVPFLRPYLTSFNPAHLVSAEDLPARSPCPASPPGRRGPDTP